MAYAFDSIMGALGEEDQEPGELAGQENNQLALTQEGGFEGGGGDPVAQPGATTSAPETSSAGNRIISQNRAAATSPVDTGQITQNIGEAKGALEAEASNYVQAADDDYGFYGGSEDGQFEFKNQDDIQDKFTAYSQGDPRNQEWLDLYQSAPGVVEDIDIQTNTDFQDANLLKNDAGIRELFRRGADPEYNIGEASLDTALLRGNQDFQVGRDQALSSYRDLLSQRAGFEQDSQGKAQAVRNLGAEAYRGQIEAAGDDWISGSVKSFERDEAARDISLTNERNDLASEESLQGQAEAYLERMRGNDTYDPSLSEHFESGDNLSQYYTQGLSAEDTKWQDFLGAENAGRFNRVLGLLDRGDTYVEGQYYGQNAKDLAQGSFDTGEFSKDVISRAGLGQQQQLEAEAAAEEQRLLEESAAEENRAALEAEEAERLSNTFAEGQAMKDRREAEEADPFSPEGLQKKVNKSVQTELDNAGRSVDSAVNKPPTNLAKKWFG